MSIANFSPPWSGGSHPTQTNAPLGREARQVSVRSSLADGSLVIGFAAQGPDMMGSEGTKLWTPLLTFSRNTTPFGVRRNAIVWSDLGPPPRMALLSTTCSDTRRARREGKEFSALLQALKWPSSRHR